MKNHGWFMGITRDFHPLIVGFGGPIHVMSGPTNLFHGKFLGPKCSMDGCMAYDFSLPFWGIVLGVNVLGCPRKLVNG